MPKMTIEKAQKSYNRSIIPLAKELISAGYVQDVMAIEGATFEIYTQGGSYYKLPTIETFLNKAIDGARLPNTYHRPAREEKQAGKRPKGKQQKPVSIPRRSLGFSDIPREGETRYYTIRSKAA